MNKNSVFIIVFAIAAFGIGYFVRQKVFGPPIPGILVLKEDLNDFGNVEFNSSAEVYFTYINTGEGPLQILDIVSSCGCTVVDWSPDELMPSESDSFLVSYDTKIPGYFSKEITISSSGPSNPNRVWITGTVLPDPK